MSTEYAYSFGHLVLSHFGTCKCSNVETNLSCTCLVSGLLSFEHPSVLQFCFVLFRFVSICFVSICFVLFRYVSFRFVSCLFRFAFYRDPISGRSLPSLRVLPTKWKHFANMYYKHGNFRVGYFRVFRAFVFFAKITPTRK